MSQTIALGIQKSGTAHHHHSSLLFQIPVVQSPLHPFRIGIRKQACLNLSSSKLQIGQIPEYRYSTTTQRSFLTKDESAHALRVHRLLLTVVIVLSRTCVGRSIDGNNESRCSIESHSGSGYRQTLSPVRLVRRIRCRACRDITTKRGRHFQPAFCVDACRVVSRSIKISKNRKLWVVIPEKAL